MLFLGNPDLPTSAGSSWEASQSTAGDLAAVRNGASAALTKSTAQTDARASSMRLRSLHPWVGGRPSGADSERATGVAAQGSRSAKER